MPIVERAKLQATEAAASITKEAPKAAWTSLSLKQFMGLSMKTQVKESKVIIVNISYRSNYFSR